MAGRDWCVFQFFIEYPGENKGRIWLDDGKGSWKKFAGGLGGTYRFFGKVSVAFT